MKNKRIMAALCLQIIGCATTPVSNTEAVNAPFDRVINARFLQPAANTGIVTIKRDSGLGASACSTRIFINAEPTADIRQSEKITVYLPEGEYIFSAIANGICAGGMTEVHATVKQGAKINFRVGYGSNSEFSINQTAF